MRADTQTISIDAPPAKVVAFLADGGNLPRWAVGFAKAATPHEGGWLVATGAGEMAVTIDTDTQRGTVDFRMRPAPGVEGLAAMRVIPRGPASEVVFTQFQAPPMPDEQFEKNVAAVRHELTVLKALLEVECPL